MIDLSPLKGVRVDPSARTVEVEPGCVWGEVDRETQVFGLAVPNGIISETGVAGLTLGGGFGWTTRRFGYTSDNLLGADIVTADGTLRRTSADEHPDLFWAIRGGGGNFGVVTSFTFRARPVGPEVLGGMILFPMARAGEVVAAFRELTHDAPDELGSLLVLRRAPPSPALPEAIHGAPVALVAVCWTGAVEAGERHLGPLRELGEPLADLIGRKPFTAIQSMLDASSPRGRQYYWKSEYVDTLTEPAAATMIRHAEALTSPQSAVLFMHLGGAADRLPEDHSATGPRDGGYVLNVQGAWIDPGERDIHVRWVRDYWQAMRPFAKGRAYMNFFTADEGAERVREAYAPATHRRLAAIKAHWDPTNLFRLNPNIAPARPDPA
jgi:FAD/FMN-containing dehydrogenase